MIFFVDLKKERRFRMEKQTISKSESLIWAKHNLSCLDQKLIQFAILKTNLETMYSVFRVVEFTDSMEYCCDRRHSEIKQKLEELKQKQLSFYEIGSEQKTITIPWCEKIIYEKEGWIVIKFHKKLLPHLFDLRNHLMRYDIKNSMKLKHKYGIRLYEIFSSCNKRTLRLSVAELRSLLPDSTFYKKFTCFEKAMLKFPIQEINQKTNLLIDYEKIKRGKYISEVQFRIRKKTAPKQKNRYG